MVRVLLESDTVLVGDLDRTRSRERRVSIYKTQEIRSLIQVLPRKRLIDQRGESAKTDDVL